MTGDIRTLALDFRVPTSYDYPRTVGGERMTETKSFAAAFAAKLRESGLTPHSAKKHGIAYTQGRVAKKLAPNIEPRAGFVVRYFAPSGNGTTFFRYRYLEPPSGFTAQRRKPPKYVQPIGTPPAVYFPARTSIKWPTIIDDPDVPLVVTEGELKALTACLAEFPTIGLGGVYAFRSKKLRTKFLEELEAIEWSGRDVYVAFDSDAARKIEVRQAMADLCTELVKRGARVYEIKLPDLPHLDKVGLDDFLTYYGNKGPGRLEALMTTAPEFERSAKLWEIGSKFVFVAGTASTIVRLPHTDEATGQERSELRLSVNAFRELLKGQVLIKVIPSKDGGEKLIERPLADEWLAWPHRVTTYGFDFEPGDEVVTARQNLNLWRGWGVDPEEGNTKLFDDLVAYLFNRKPDRIEWFLRWLAYPLQHPGAKLASAVVLWGHYHGTGKSLLAKTIGKLYGKSYTSIGGESIVQGRYTEWAVGKCFITIDEIAGGEKRANSELLKRLVTQDTMYVDQKYIPTFTIPDRINYILTSNQPDPIYVERTDRRFFINEVTGDPMKIDFYKRYDKALNRDPREKLARAVLDKLMRLDLGDFYPMMPALVTDDKAAMSTLSKTDLYRFAEELAESPDEMLDGLSVMNGLDLFTAGQLAALYSPIDGRKTSANAMGRALINAGIPRVGGAQYKTQTKHGSMVLYAVRNAKKWAAASLPTLIAHYEEHHPKVKF